MKPIRIKPWKIQTLRLSIHGFSNLLLGFAYYQALLGLVLGDPVQYLLDFTGIGALNLLALSLVISPIASKLKFAQLMPLRRTLGIYSAIYAIAHFYAFVAFELQFEWLIIVSEIIERPYITVGFIALFLLTTLLITSNRISKNWLKSRWQKLHNYVYISVCLGVLHYLWAVKTIGPQPVIYAFIFALLLFARRKKITNLFKK
ncbi:protein-methionine-sulfoxide reductase heme-binding subunit MsrQ [Glaciecola sp. KUL10]|uniref:protein-methionine-sulfoxide reductase heme-binding subunit MsrQ n=1 Tax=Glaciecola sp. (strain KUL10) TaxID=2161813 RepID=UPI000D7889DD|nr:protein-methionine-sulfoxide reductase heme-binding subunit MsrQ [Glaciecola sp. KUL10]